MTEAPVTIRPDTKVREAIELLQTLDIRHLPVVDEDGDLMAMLSDRDLRALEIPYFVGQEYAGRLRTALDAPVSTLVSADVATVDAEADIAEVVDTMLDRNIGAVPVTDADRTLVGIVSYVDLLRTMPVDEAHVAPAVTRLRRYPPTGARIRQTGR
jgi:acetoin utilization protein AcuB